jgi:hypothetical protein
VTATTLHDHADALRADCRRLPDGPTRDALRRRLPWLLWLLWEAGER